MKKAAILLLDRSHSMTRIVDNTLSSINKYLAEVKVEPELEFTLITFDTISTDVLFRRMPIAEVPEITREHLVPRGATPLIDALCITIGAAKQDYAADDRVIIISVTDGHENSSTEFRIGQLHALIKERSEAGWQFVFLGASIDAYGDAGRFGIGAGTTMSYDSANRAMSEAAFSTVARSNRAFYASGKAVNFTNEDKQSVGDRFIPRSGGEGSGAKVKTKAKSLVDTPKL
jgi:hypothetical protein